MFGRIMETVVRRRRRGPEQDEPAVVAHAHSQRDAGQWSDAAKAYWQALDVYPMRADLWAQYSRVLKEAGDLEGSENAHRRSVALSFDGAEQPGGPDGPSAQTAPSETPPQAGHADWAEIGRTCKRSGRYDDAVEAFARAVIGGRDAPAVRRELDHLTGFCAEDTGVALRAAFVQAVSDGAFVAPSARSMVRAQFARFAYSSVDSSGTLRRHARLARKAADRARTMDFIWLPNIDWGYRTQRAQHLAAAMTARGHRVFFISPTVERAADGERRYRLVSNPADGVFEVRLRSYAGGRRPADSVVDETSADIIASAIEQLRVELGLQRPLVVVQHANWEPVAIRLSRAALVYDCMDDQSAFPGAAGSVGVLHERMIAASDVVVTTSCALQGEIGAARPSILVRNAASSSMYAEEPRRPSGAPVIGYFGALEQWFNMDWVVQAAKAHREWRFVLVGQVGACDAASARAAPNIQFAGEVDYAALPALLRTFSVGVIPFRISRLTAVTDPVKLYEYLAGGCPVVTSEMPEVMALHAPGVVVASSAAAFEAGIAHCLEADNDTARRERVQWARRHGWADRAAAFEEAVRSCIQAPVPEASVA